MVKQIRISEASKCPDTGLTNIPRELGNQFPEVASDFKKKKKQGKALVWITGKMYQQEYLKDIHVSYPTNKFNKKWEMSALVPTRWLKQHRAFPCSDNKSLQRLEIDTKKKAVQEVPGKTATWKLALLPFDSKLLLI